MWGLTAYEIYRTIYRTSNKEQGGFAMKWLAMAIGVLFVFGLMHRMRRAYLEHWLDEDA